MKNEDVYFSLSRSLYGGFTFIYGVVAHYEVTRIKRQERIALVDDIDTGSYLTDVYNIRCDYMNIENDIILVMKKNLQDKLRLTPPNSDKNGRVQNLLDRITTGIIKRPADPLVVTDYSANLIW